MADIRPFAGIRYAGPPNADLSKLIAPPYDVLDARSKATLLAKSPKNIVEIDLPFVPPKQLGPPEVYAHAAVVMSRWLTDGTLKRATRKAIYPYEQRYQHNGRTIHRRGIVALVRLTPFGEDVIPHEKTYDGPIEDRLHLMRETGAQLSPVFGLFMDPGDKILSRVFDTLAMPAAHATLDGVQNFLWDVPDGAVENELMLAMKDKKVYIADGHHRYTTALHYQKQMIAKNGGQPLPPDHPANFCMMVLVNGADPSMLILPTHRLVGGLAAWDVDAFAASVTSHFDVQRAESPTPAALAAKLASIGSHTFGLYDGKTRSLITLRLTDAALMKTLEPAKSDAWRALDVAILHRYLFDEVLVPNFGGERIVRGYTADANEVAPRVDAGEFQAAFLIQPTPIRALADLGEHGEVMPQKSTYFFPKLATGMVINPLR
jgi:uncharacterized protein (DUF1015 family)